MENSRLKRCAIVPLYLTSFGCLILTSTCPGQNPVWAQIKCWSPTPRAGHGLAYDSARQRTVLFGGIGQVDPTETLEWDGKNWAKIKATTSPPARTAHAMSYDTAR